MVGYTTVVMALLEHQSINVMEEFKDDAMQVPTHRYTAAHTESPHTDTQAQ